MLKSLTASQSRKIVGFCIYVALAIILVGLLFSPFKILGIVYGAQLILALILIFMFQVPLIFSVSLPTKTSLFIVTLYGLFCALFLSFFLIDNPFLLFPKVQWINLLVLAPLSEELLYRGAILGGFNKLGINRTISVLLSSVVFAVYHFNTLLLNPSLFNFVILQVLGAFVMGIILGNVYAETNSISKTV